MIDSDFKDFSDAWTDAHEIMPGGKALSAGAMTMCFDALTRFPLDAVLFAINRHVETGRFAPIPKDIADILEAGNKHIGADEAWSIVLESFDESTTVVMTQPMMDARLVAYPVWEEGDKIGARMAFKSAYERAVQIASPPKWIVSEGFDKKAKEAALQKAASLGRLTHQEAARYLPAPMDGGPIGKLLTGKVTSMPTNNDALAARWGELGQALRDGQHKLEEAEIQRREQERLEFERKRAEQLKTVEELLKEQAKLGVM